MEKNQGRFREDFGLMRSICFQFLYFSLIVYNAFSDVIVKMFNQFLAWFGIQNLVAIEIGGWPLWLKLLTMFILRILFNGMSIDSYIGYPFYGNFIKFITLFNKWDLQLIYVIILWKHSFTVPWNIYPLQ